MSVNQADSSDKKSAVPEEPAQWPDDDLQIPPRRVLHQPEFLKVTRYFQVGLLTLFLLLTGGMFIWYHWFNH